MSKAPTRKSLGQIAYEAYYRASDGKSLISGETLPQFYWLLRPLQNAWEEAADAVSIHVEEFHRNKGDC